MKYKLLKSPFPFFHFLHISEGTGVLAAKFAASSDGHLPSTYEAASPALAGLTPAHSSMHTQVWRFLCQSLPSLGQDDHTQYYKVEAEWQLLCHCGG